MRTLLGSVRSGANAIVEAYEEYRKAFRSITQRARQRFEQRDWPGGARDARERLELYRHTVDVVVAALEDLLAGLLRDPAAWRLIKGVYAEAIGDFPDLQLAETFFNSVTRRLFVTVGVDPAIEFVDLDARRDRYGHGGLVHQSFAGSTTREILAATLSSSTFAVPFCDLDRDVGLAAEALEGEWSRAGHEPSIESIDVIGSVFYRGTGAYLVGRIRGGGETAPLVMVLVHGEHGIEIDAVLCTEREVSIVFSYTRSHFLVEVERPADVMEFLSSILPRKRVAELYICLGYSKHGKTELYRDLVGHLGRSMDRFDFARGTKGMVMVVFTLPSFDYVFKVIRDEFAPPKNNTREDVMNRYRLVFRHDRAGRLIEAQEFEHLVFERHRFAPDVLEELAGSASATVTVGPERVHIRHLYIERRVEPLDLFLRNTNDEDACRAVRDYGHAIRNLATTNIFPGDLLLKNFGVTRHGRVTFYDYDELCLVTDCVFRHMPTPRGPDEELAAEPWFYVGQNDVFPEEFLQFMGFTELQRRAFLEEHREVLTADFWLGLQKRHVSGEVLDVFPYPPSKRLRESRDHDRAPSGPG
jgi:isocitrate dehydrogenase kinase/phosphatase